MIRIRPDRREFISAAAPFVAGVGLGSRPLAALADAPPDFLNAADRAAALDQLRSMVIVHGGDTGFARAFRGPGPSRPVNVKSVSKTIVALLTGVAIERGALSGPEARLGDVIPRLIPRGADPRVEEITVADLLTMRAGVARTSGPNYGRWVESGNWISYALSQPFEAEPGERFQYSTGSFHILGAVLATVTGRSLHALARDWLGAPLGVEIPQWTRDPQGFYMGGNNMALSPVALARIGEMVRLGGVWRDRQVTPAAWIEASWRPRTRSPWSGDEYGYGWFLTELAGERAAYARGYGGQMLFVLPRLELTVAITSDPGRPARSGGYVGDLRRLVSDAIVPAIRA